MGENRRETNRVDLTVLELALELTERSPSKAGETLMGFRIVRVGVAETLVLMQIDPRLKQETIRRSAINTILKMYNRVGPKNSKLNLTKTQARILEGVLLMVIPLSTVGARQAVADLRKSTVAIGATEAENDLRFIRAILARSRADEIDDWLQVEAFNSARDARSERNKDQLLSRKKGDNRRQQSPADAGSMARSKQARTPSAKGALVARLGPNDFCMSSVVELSLKVNYATAKYAPLPVGITDQLETTRGAVYLARILMKLGSNSSRKHASAPIHLKTDLSGDGSEIPKTEVRFLNDAIKVAEEYGLLCPVGARRHCFIGGPMTAISEYDGKSRTYPVDLETTGDSE